MFKCIFIKKKLYDYLDSCLSQADRTRVEKHLAICPDCDRLLGRMSRVIELAKNKKIPEPQEAFWYDFKTGLDRKLNARLLPEFDFKPKLKINLRPAFAYASVLILILAMGTYFYTQKKPLQFSQSDADLVNELELLEEVSQDTALNHDEKAYIDEINLLYQLDLLNTPS